VVPCAAELIWTPALSSIEILFFGGLQTSWLNHNPIDQGNQPQNKQQSRTDSHTDDVERVELFNVLLVFGILTKTDK